MNFGNKFYKIKKFSLKFDKNLVFSYPRRLNGLGCLIYTISAASVSHGLNSWFSGCLVCY